MIEITEFIKKYMTALDQAFPDRVWFAGLQGSYGRGEATEASDIDMVVILDQLSASDIRTYDAMLDTLPCRELICGFLSGRQELENWEPSELFQFCRDTTPIRGSLDQVLSSVTSADIARAIKSGACGVYHGCVHNMLYEKSEDILKGLYKSASFVLQAVPLPKGRSLCTAYGGSGICPAPRGKRRSPDLYGVKERRGSCL